MGVERLRTRLTAFKKQGHLLGKTMNIGHILHNSLVPFELSRICYKNMVGFCLCSIWPDYFLAFHRSLYVSPLLVTSLLDGGVAVKA